MKPGSTIIRDVKIKGTLEFSESLFLDCHFDGEILSEGELTIGENASVKGEIKAEQITLYGKLHGNIVSKGACRIKETGILIGDIKADKIEISEGAIFQGYAAVPFKSVEEVNLPEMDAQLEMMETTQKDEAPSTSTKNDETAATSTKKDETVTASKQKDETSPIPTKENEPLPAS